MIGYDVSAFVDQPNPEFQPNTALGSYNNPVPETIRTEIYGKVVATGVVDGSLVVWVAHLYTGVIYRVPCSRVKVRWT